MRFFNNIRASGTMHQKDFATASSFKYRLYGVSRRMEGALLPKLRYSQSIYEDFLQDQVRPNILWLDLGCGWHILPPWRMERETNLVAQCETVVGIDYEFDPVERHSTIKQRVCGDVKKLPFRNESFDLATCNMGLEHFKNPVNAFREFYRVLKPGGRFLLHTPNIYGYDTALGRLIPEGFKRTLIKLLDDRDETDTFKTFYHANSPGTIKALAYQTGFQAVKVKMLVSSARLRIAPPLLLLELLLIRALMSRRLKILRPNIIALLIKDGKKRDKRPVV